VGPSSVKPVAKRGSRLMSSVPTMLITRLDCLLKHTVSADIIQNLTVVTFSPKTEGTKTKAAIGADKLVTTQI
jgi:hypothetical protein